MVNPEKVKLSSRPEKPSPPPDLIGKKSSALAKELKKDEYFSRLQNTPRETREEMGEILGDKRVFGSLVEKGDSLKIQSLEKELRGTGSSSDSRIREIGKTIKGKYGSTRAKILADIIHEKYFGKK